MQSTPTFFMFHDTQVLHKRSLRQFTGITQYGLKPQTPYDFKCVTNLVNHGKGTEWGTLGIRRNPMAGKFGSAPTFMGLPLNREIPKMIGTMVSDDNQAFCSTESARLRACMARGESNCERESSILDQCLARVRPLQSELHRVQRRFTDFFIQQVSDNGMKPFEHRKHDHQDYFFQMSKSMNYKQGMIQRSRYRGGTITTFHKWRKHPGTKSARRTWLPVNN